VSLNLDSSDQAAVVLLKPDDCETYLLPNLDGDLEGLYLANPK